MENYNKYSFKQSYRLYSDNHIANIIENYLHKTDTICILKNLRNI